MGPKKKKPKSGPEKPPVPSPGAKRAVTTRLVTASTRRGLFTNETKAWAHLKKTLPGIDSSRRTTKISIVDAAVSHIIELNLQLHKGMRQEGRGGWPVDLSFLGQKQEAGPTSIKPPRVTSHEIEVPPSCNPPSVASHDSGYESLPSVGSSLSSPQEEGEAANTSKFPTNYEVEDIDMFLDTFPTRKSHVKESLVNDQEREYLVKYQVDHEEEVLSQDEEEILFQEVKMVQEYEKTIVQENRAMDQQTEEVSQYEVLENATPWSDEMKEKQDEKSVNIEDANNNYQENKDSSESENNDIILYDLASNTYTVMVEDVSVAPQSDSGGGGGPDSLQ